MAKINYRIHTDAIKVNLIPNELTPQQTSIIYAFPSYMNGYEDDAIPFWKIDDNGKKVGDYSYIKEALGF